MKTKPKTRKLFRYARAGSKNSANNHAVNGTDTVAGRLDTALKESAETGNMIDISDAFQEPGFPAGYSSPSGISNDLAVIARQAQHVSFSYQREFILRAVHRFLLRGVPIPTIAQAFDVSPSTVFRWRKELKDRFIQEANSMDFFSYVGETMEFYRFMMEEAIKISMDKQESAKGRVYAINAALSAKQQEQRFLQAVGYYDHNQFTGHVESDDTIEKTNQLRKISRNILEEFPKKTLDKISQKDTEFAEALRNVKEFSEGK